MTHDIAPSAPRRHPGRLWPHAWWAIVGTMWALGVVSLLTIGVVLVIAASGLGLLGLAIPRTRHAGHLGGLAGLAAAPLTLAWLNREGPGTVCHTSGDVTDCEELWSPWPFVAVALALVVAAVVLVDRRRMRAASAA
ncbi:hypothetical protein GCM10022215_43360 [Nocardioides fonticola]|uniref:Uncharacterized protein n=1 Tax=Nocardioides fonticola TaxID=450363 RepID=A0ABP7Y398_9ACTN